MSYKSAESVAVATVEDKFAAFRETTDVLNKAVLLDKIQNDHVTALPAPESVPVWIRPGMDDLE